MKVEHNEQRARLASDEQPCRPVETPVANDLVSVADRQLSAGLPINAWWTIASTPKTYGSRQAAQLKRAALAAARELYGLGPIGERE